MRTRPCRADKFDYKLIHDMGNKAIKKIYGNPHDAAVFEANGHFSKNEVPEKPLWGRRQSEYRNLTKS